VRSILKLIDAALIRNVEKLTANAREGAASPVSEIRLHLVIVVIVPEPRSFSSPARHQSYVLRPVTSPTCSAVGAGNGMRTDNLSYRREHRTKITVYRFAGLMSSVLLILFAIESNIDKH